MRQSNTLTALVISAMEVNWSRHYMRSVGIPKNEAEMVIKGTTAKATDTRLSGDIKYVRFVLDTVTREY